MSTTHRPGPAPSSEAIFRYSVIAQVEALLLGGWSASAAVREVAGREHVRLDGVSRRVTVRTLQRWRAAWQEGRLPALERRNRPRTDSSVVLPAALVAFFRSEKTSDPRASVPELLRRARVRKVIPNDLPVDRATAWRTCRRLGLVTRMRPSKREGDMRRWRYPHRMQCVLCDGKHFRAGPDRNKRTALFFLDDATRFGLGVRVGTSESTELFLLGLYNVVRKHGLADLYYLDHGPGFASDDTMAVVEGPLGAWLILGTSRYPQGHGAIERFQRTAQAQVLRSLDGALDVDPDCRALDLRLGHFLDRYNDTPHEGLGLDTPRQRWETGRPLRFPADEDDLYHRFVVRESRKVSPDHVIRQGGRLWEAPRGLGGSQVEVVRHVLDGRLWVPHDGRMVELAELDVHANATERRGRPGEERPLLSEGVPTTAATEAFRRTLLPIVAKDGGYQDEEDR
jgi:hypothetical protein